MLNITALNMLHTSAFYFPNSQLLDYKPRWICVERWPLLKMECFGDIFYLIPFVTSILIGRRDKIYDNLLTFSLSHT